MYMTGEEQPSPLAKIKYMKPSSLISLLLLAPLAGLAQSTVFNDTFNSGSTFNGDSIPAADATSYDFASGGTGVENLSSGRLSFQLSQAATSGFIEAQAVFTGTPVTLATIGDYVDLTYTFTDTANLLAGGGASAILTGLYNSGGSTPVAGTANASGNAVTLNTSPGSAHATGNAANWQGYVFRLAGGGGSSQMYTRPLQNGAGTASANQDLLGNNFGAGAFNNPVGTQIGPNFPVTAALTAGAQYTMDYRLTLSGAGFITISDYLYAGVGTAGTQLAGLADASNTFVTNSFDGLAIGILNNGNSLDPHMDINQITVTDLIQSAPEPATWALLGLGSLAGGWYRQRRHAR